MSLSSIFAIPIAILCLAVLLLGLPALRERTRTHAVWAELAEPPADPPPAFTPAMLQGLPPAAQRYFLQAIAPGTPLARRAVLRMEGQFATGPRARPGWRSMRASEVLALPQGLVWTMEAGAISGSDGISPGQSWTAFRLAGLIPVARAGGNPDHRRSAFARLVSEAAVWTPAAVLPGPGITWEETAPDSLRLTVRDGGLSQAVELRLAPDGAPREVRMMRWTDANPERQFRLQPFGVRLDAQQEFGGFRIPTEAQASNLFATPEEAPFFRARLTSAEFA